jgi:hypothetical protein
MHVVMLHILQGLSASASAAVVCTCVGMHNVFVSACGKLPLHLAVQGGHLAAAAALATALTAAKVTA